MTRITIAEAARRLLAEQRAMTSESLGVAIREQGLTRATSPTQAVSAALNVRPEFRRLPDDRWVLPAQLLDGAVLTHRVTAAEAAAGAQALTPDLAPLAALVHTRPSTVTGEALTFLWDARAASLLGDDVDAAVAGPAGWLAASPGELVHVRVAGSVVSVTTGPDAGSRSRMTVRRLGQAARSRLDEPFGDLDGLPPVVGIDTIVLELLADDPDLLAAPLPPLGAALESEGLEVHRGFVGLPHTDWAAVDAFFDDDGEDIESLIDDLAETFGLTTEEATTLQVLLGVSEAAGINATLIDRTLAADLARAMSVAAITRALVRIAGLEPDLEPFIASVAGQVEGPTVAGPRFILASIAESRDDVDAAETGYRAALDADPDFPLALIELARYETDRGEYASALERLRKARMPDVDEERAWLERRVGPAFVHVGRNEPCPCGSGRKFKVCHLGRPADVVTVKSAEALIHKLWLWQTQPDLERRRDGLLADALAAVGRGPSGDENGDGDGERWDDLPHTDFLTGDIVAFEQRQLIRFLDVRGPLLPAAEVALGRAWLGTRRSLFEVDAVRGTTVTLRDLRDPGPAVALTDRAMAGQLQPLDVLCTRLLPDGEGGLTVAGGFLVPRPRRREVIDLLDRDDAIALLRWLVEPARLPVLQNTEGEPLELITLTYRLPDPEAAARAFGRILDVEDTDDPHGGRRFTESYTGDRGTWLRGSITIEGSTATIETNSTRRAERLERTLRRAAPGATRVSRKVRSMDELLAEVQPESGGAGRRATGTGGQLDPRANPDVAAALRDFIEQAERRWIDESIPALGGMTPREALADPAMRPELEGLLDDMAWQGRGSGDGTMSAARVRALLGLPPGRA